MAAGSPHFALGEWFGGQWKANQTVRGWIQHGSRLIPWHAHLTAVALPASG